MSIDTTITLNGRRIHCRGTHVYRGPEEEEGEGDMLDPGLVMTGTKCGHNHVSPCPSLPPSETEIETEIEKCGLWRKALGSQSNSIPPTGFCLEAPTHRLWIRHVNELATVICIISHHMKQK